MSVRLDRTTLTVFACVVLSGLATSVVMPILAPLIRELRLSESQGGWMISIGSLAMAALAPVWGIASDRFGRKPIMLAGFAGLFVGYALFTGTVWYGLTSALAGTALLVLLVATRALVGGFLPAVPASAQALMADNTAPHERASGMAVISAASGIGLVIGPALGGVLALWGLVWPLILTTCLCLAACVIVLLVVPRAPPRTRIERTPASPFTPALRPWLAAGTLTMCSIVTIQISAGFYFQDMLGLTTAQTGPLLAIALTLVGAMLFAAQVIQVKVLRWPPRTMILAGAGLWLAGLAILLFTVSLPTYLLAYAFMGAGAGLLIPGYMSGASLAMPADQQGAVGGFSAATQGIGGVLAPVASTTLYGVDRSLPFWCILGLMALVFCLFLPRGAGKALSV